MTDGKDWLSEAMDKQFAKIKDTGHKPPMRIVSWQRYREAERAQNEGATPWQIEKCLAGASWDEVRKENMNNVITIEELAKLRTQKVAALALAEWVAETLAGDALQCAGLHRDAKDCLACKGKVMLEAFCHTLD